ncbi:hypothetical protein [Sphingobacterium corticibacterium]|uniref:Uncharacterized protein n=1 Tax=Sphingobacterium corticibacterium TaxID=2484746 RepID=A0A4Q6XY99_9SPHI|nr:hypothetical protein [Sphingobacterium corticibacterium]RZF61767.1 hypothetical protein EWE74_02720 [Sphingobacterium corticibacterium]
MFTKLIAIDDQKIGTVHFHAFVIKIKEDEVGFAIFLNELTTPLLYFYRDGIDSITFKIDNEQFMAIVKNSKFTKEIRKELYKDFEFFLRTMEERATAYLFKNVAVKYITNSRDIIRYKNYYISANTKMFEQE